MKKFIFMMIAFISMFAMDATAQTVYQKQKVFDNTYVGINAGITSPLNFDHVTPFNTAVGIRVGKDLNTVFGVQVAAEALLGDNGSAISNSKTFVRGLNLELNGTLNWSNLLLGYKGTPRKFEVGTVTGVGFGTGFGTDEVNNGRSFTGKTALEFALNLDKARSWRVYAQPGVYWNLAGENRNIQFNKDFAQLAVLVGVDYKFKTSNGTHNFKTYDVGALNTEINNLRAELAKKPKEVIEHVTEYSAPVITNPFVVYFDQGKFNLTDAAKATLDNVPTSAVVDVVGHVSPEGTEAFNQILSENRAKAVADYLTNRGVKVNSVTGVGKTGKPQNRVVIVTEKK